MALSSCHSGIDAASLGQNRIWSAEQISAENSQIIPLSYIIEGELDVSLLERALSLVVAKNEALHTGLAFRQGKVFRKSITQTFRLERLGSHVQVDNSRADVITETILKFYLRRFDLEKDLMLRALLVTTSSTKHLLFLVIHHSAGDGASVDLIEGQISRLYHGESADDVFALSRPYSDYVQSVARQCLRGEFNDALENLVRLQLKDSIDLKQQHSFLPGNSCSKFKRFDIPERIHAFARLRAESYIGAGPALVYIAAFHLLLCAIVRRRNFKIGFPTHNRTNADMENICGFIMNIIVLNLDLSPSWSTADFLSSTAKAFQGMRNFITIPYGLLLRKLNGGDDYRFDTVPFGPMFTYQPQKKTPLVLSGCKVSLSEPPFWPAAFPLMLDVEDNGQKASALLRWNGQKYPSWIAEVLEENYPTLVEQLCTDRSAALSDLLSGIQAKAYLAEERAGEGLGELRSTRVGALIAG